MENNEKAIITEKSDKNVKSKKPSCAISLLSVRIMVCLMIFGAVIFVKLNNPCIFEAFRFWYQNNVYEEKFNAERMREKGISLFFKAKEKVLDAVSIYH